TGCDFVTERVALEVLGGHKELAVVLYECIHSTDSRVIQRGRRTCFPSEPLPLRRIATHPWWQRLQCDRSAEPCVSRQIDPSHTAAAELADDRVLADDVAGRIAGFFL